MRFDVYAGTNGGPRLLDCQANVFKHFSTRFVVPLLPVDGVPAPTRRLHPVLVVEGVEFVMATHLAAAVPVRSLGQHVVSLSTEDARIVDALDMLMIGY